MDEVWTSSLSGENLVYLCFLWKWQFLGIYFEIFWLISSKSIQEILVSDDEQLAEGAKTSRACFS